MVPPESERPENEESNSSNLESEAASDVGSSAVGSGSFQGEVDEMLNSIEIDDSDAEEIEPAKGLEKDGKDQNADSEEPQISAADDLRMKAGSILNGEYTELPEIELDSETESDADEDGLMSMPDPQSLMSELDGDAESKPGTDVSDEGELLAMPDPRSLMQEASAKVDEAETKGRANIAERAGDLPPPPPAPVALEDEKIEREFSGGDGCALEVEEEEEQEDPSEPEEFPAEKIELNKKEETPEEAPTTAPVVEEGVQPVDPARDDPVEEKGEGDSSLDEDDSFFMDDEEDNDLLVSIQDDSENEILGNLSGISSDEPGECQSSSKNGFLKTAIQSLPFAAALAVLGIGLTAFSFKNEFFEWAVHGDTKGSSLSRSIARATNELFDHLGPDSPYEMAWMESEIKRVSDRELLVEVQIGAQLKVDLYQAVDDAVLYSKLPFDLDELTEAAKSMKSIGRDDISIPPKRWNGLYRHSASKGALFPFSVSYRLLKSSTDSNWEISGMRMREGEHGFAWSRGHPKAFFGESAMDISSNRFVISFRAYEKTGLDFLNKVTIAEKEYLAMLDEAEEQAKEERQDLKMSLSQGSYFKGMVIAGDEGADASEVSLIITETRNDGEVIKGVLRLEKEESSTKHFTGFFDVVENEQGIQGRLDLTTIAFSGQTSLDEVPTFFNPGTVSRITLQTDGYRMEGDADELSLRLIRSL